ncbi:MAG: MFS family transporter [Burkholderiaceae bacterium]|jgi:MHS family dicarboxylic acid transporter PcaT-like MFS transporter
MDAVASETIGHYSFEEKRRRIFAIMAASSGNLVEWFDFYVYSFTTIYFAQSFFPKSYTTIQQYLYSAAVFAIGFLMRPIGGWMFGKIADRRGRKTSLVISVVMMCAGSLAVAVLPTYQQIGFAAPLLLLLARMVQGLSVGGEYGATATYLSEVALRGERGFYSSFQYVTLIGGQLLAVAVVVILKQFLSDAEMQDFGWRIPFVIGAITAVVALLLRRSLHETASAKDLESKEAGSFGVIWRDHRAAFLTVLGYTAGGSLIFYTFTTYMQKYLIASAHMSKTTASNISLVTLFVYMCMQPLFGMLSDRIGRRMSMMLFGALGTLLTVPLMTAIGSAATPVIAGVLICVALAVVSLYTSVSAIVKAEMFPAQVRALGVGVGYAISNAIFGGSAELVALQLKAWQMESTFFWYVTVMMVIVFLVSLRLPRTASYLHTDH